MAGAKSSNTNWFAIWVSIAVVVVLVGLGSVVVLLNNQATAPGAIPKSNSTFDAESGAVTFGEGKDKVAIYVDFQCPICNSFEQQFGASLEAAAADGKITLEYHPIAILDRYSQGTEYSSRSAGIEPRQVSRLREAPLPEPARGEYPGTHDGAACGLRQRCGRRQGRCLYH